MPAVDISAARTADGAKLIAFVNVDPDEQADVAVAGLIGGRITGQLLTGARMDSRNRFNSPEEVHLEAFHDARWSSGSLHVTIPARSIVLLTAR